ncbi:MAG: adenosylhomocysteinase [Methanobacteriota archaeon]|nr:MAG: adenosylhomocysteinase [Euryarchaeota archaeon]
MSELVNRGVLRLEWARAHMPVLAVVRKGLVESGALKGVKIGMALHTEAKTGVLALTLKEAGAKVRLASCNPQSTDDSVAAALNERFGLETHAKKWETTDQYYENLNRILDLEPDLVIDDGADLIHLLHTKRTDLLRSVRGGNEETTTGIVRLRAMEKEGKLAFPVVDVNDAKMKHLFDNRYGTGQSTMDGILTATNLLVAGKTFVVAGYGWCGRGIASRAHGLGANVVVTEIDPVKAIEATMDGFRVMPMAEAVTVADFIVSATGMKDVVREDHLRAIKDGCVLANAGHFDNEISKVDLERLGKKRRVREFVDEYAMKGGKKVYLLAEGRLVNLAAGQGHPAEIMDMSFSIQALSADFLARQAESLGKRVVAVPEEIDDRVARLKLETMSVSIDTLTPEQRRYGETWLEGT